MQNPSPAPTSRTRFIFDTIPRTIAASLLLVAVVINFSNVVGRYLFRSPIFWADEVLVFLVIWCVFLCLTAITYNGGHLKMDLISSMLRGPWRIIANASVVALMLACGAVMVWHSTSVVQLLARTGQVSVGAGVPMALAHAAIPVGFALMILVILLRIRCYLTDRFD